MGSCFGKCRRHLKEHTVEDKEVKHGATISKTHKEHDIEDKWSAEGSASSADDKV